MSISWLPGSLAYLQAVVGMYNESISDALKSERHPTFGSNLYAPEPQRVTSARLLAYQVALTIQADLSQPPCVRLVVYFCLNGQFLLPCPGSIGLVGIEAISCAPWKYQSPVTQHWHCAEQLVLFSGCTQLLSLFHDVKVYDSHNKQHGGLETQGH